LLIVAETTGPSTHDPLTLRSALAVFRRHLEGTACVDAVHGAACPCQILGKLYGPRRYHCRKLFCSAYVSGFPTKAARDQHVEAHSRNFKCPKSDCVFASTGFRSSLELSRHTESAHRVLDTPSSSVSVSGSSGSSLTVLLPHDQQLVVEDAVTNSQLATVQHLILVERLATDFHSRQRFILSAAAHSTPELLTWLLDSHPAAKNSDAGDNRTLDEALGAAIDRENLPNIKFLLSRGADIMANSTPSLSPLLRALRRWNGDLMGFLVRECGVTLPRKWPEPDKMLSPANIFGTPHLARASLEEIKRRFAALKPYVLWPEAYKFGTCRAAESGRPPLLRFSLEIGGDPNKTDTPGTTPLLESVTHSGSDGLEMIEMLLKAGADINSTNHWTNLVRRDATRDFTVLYWVAISAGGDGGLTKAKLLLERQANPNLGISPLYAAVLRGKAEMVKLLLQYGADPSPGGEQKTIDKLKGMQRVEKYFAAPWNDIVGRIQAGEDLEGGLRRKRN